MKLLFEYFIQLEGLPLKTNTTWNANNVKHLNNNVKHSNAMTYKHSHNNYYWLGSDCSLLEMCPNVAGLAVSKSLSLQQQPFLTQDHVL